VAVFARPVSAQVSFGAAVTVGEGEVLVGEPGHQLRPGLLHVFTRGPDGTWALNQSLEAPDGTPGDGFGSALALDGDALVVAASGPDYEEDPTGAVYVFRKTGDSWSFESRLEPDAAVGEGFVPEAVDLDGDWAIVGASGQNDGRGAVLAFHREGGEWAYHSRLSPGELAADDLFGAALVMSGDRAFVSAPATGNLVGAVYGFRYDAVADVWRPTGRLGTQIQQQQAALGSALAMIGDRVFATGPGLLGVGAVLGFSLIDGDDYELADILLPFDGSGAGFGTSLGVAGDELWVGTANAGNGEGRAFVYRSDPETGEWVGVEKTAAAGLAQGDSFGLLLSASGDVMVASALGQDYGAGSAFVFEREGETWAEAGRLVSGVTGPDAITGSEVACSSEGEAALFGCSSVDLLSFLPLADMGAGRGVVINDLWGWTDPETGRDVIIAGMTDQTVFVDVSDPLEPAYLGRLPMTEGANGSAWRDMKVYSDHVFVVSDGSGDHGMQIFDLGHLRDLDGSNPVTFTEDAHYDGVREAHNVVINEETGFAYIVGAGGGGETCGGGLHMVDIHDPLNPTFVGCFADPTTGRSSTGYTHDAQCVVYHGPDEAYQGHEICFGSNETALSIADVTDKENPVAITMATYPNVAYAHQGWLSEDHRYFYSNDELDETGGQVATTRTLVWDIQELGDPILAKEYFSENPSSDHNLYVVGSTMYQSNYESGLRVLDIADPVNPVQVGFFDTVPYGNDEPGFNGSWSNYPFFESGIVVVSSSSEGLFIVRPQPRIVS
jgi:choice-of-anchor B domain-containing protein